jgi:hypothetical protein
MPASVRPRKNKAAEKAWRQRKKPSVSGRLVIYFEHTSTLHTFLFGKLFLCTFRMFHFLHSECECNIKTILNQINYKF